MADLIITLNTTATVIDVVLDGKKSALGPHGTIKVPCASGAHHVSWAFGGGTPNSPFTLDFSGVYVHKVNGVLDANGNYNGLTFQVA